MGKASAMTSTAATFEARRLSVTAVTNGSRFNAVAVVMFFGGEPNCKFTA